MCASTECTDAQQPGHVKRLDARNREWLCFSASSWWDSLIIYSWVCDEDAERKASKRGDALKIKQTVFWILYGFQIWKRGMNKLRQSKFSRSWHKMKSFCLYFIISFWQNVTSLKFSCYPWHFLLPYNRLFHHLVLFISSNDGIGK